MGWVKDAIKELEEKGTCQIRPFGGSMRGKIESGQLVTLVRPEESTIEIDDVVLVKWKGNYILHLIKEIEESRILIGNNVGKINGWVSINDVIAVVIKIED